jgi:hypothetical protein
MAKRRAGSQIGSLTPDHYKSGIDLFPMSDSKVRHRVGNLLRRATTLLQTSSQLDSVVGSYELPKSRDSNRDNFETISGFQLGSPGKKSHLDVASMESCRVYYKGEGGDFPQVRAVVSLVCPCCPWHVLTPKVLQLCTNHFVWVLCRPV